MTTAVFANDFGATHAQTIVVLQLYCVTIRDIRKAWPTLQAWRIGIIFVVAFKYHMATGHTSILATRSILIKLARKWRLGPPLAQDGVLLWG